MTMTVEQFINTYQGQAVLLPNGALECVGLFWRYNLDANQGEPYSAWGAADLWPIAWTTYTKAQTPTFGAWAIWSGTTGALTNAGAGHVAMFISDNGDGTGQFFSQNPGPAVIQTLPMAGILGYLTATNLPTEDTMPTATEIASAVWSQQITIGGQTARALDWLVAMRNDQLKRNETLTAADGSTARTVDIIANVGADVRAIKTVTDNL